MTQLSTESVYKKYAILSMDVEDWYHLDYFINKNFDRSYSLLDGLDRYVELLHDFQIPSSFFILSSMLKTTKTCPPNFFVKLSKLALILSVAE